MNSVTDLRPAALDWVARLPMLGAYEVSLLLGLNESLAASLLAQLERDGWLDSMPASSPEFEPARLYSLTDDGLDGLVGLMKPESRETEGLFRTRKAERALRVDQVEINVGVNRFAAELSLALQAATDLALEDLRSLPLRCPQGAWWPRGVEAYGCLRAGSGFAPFFIVWDRAGAPAFHRRRRVSGWYGFREREQPWGHELPSILVICPGAGESAQWEDAVLAAADRRGAPPLPVLPAELDALFAADPLDAIWRRLGGAAELPLKERLTWRRTIPLQAARPGFQSSSSIIEPLIDSGGPGRHPKPGTRRPRPVELGATEQRLLEWLGFHPLLSAAELAVLLRAQEDSVAHLLKGLAEKGLVDSVEEEVPGCSVATS